MVSFEHHDDCRGPTHKVLPVEEDKKSQEDVDKCDLGCHPFSRSVVWARCGGVTPEFWPLFFRSVGYEVIPRYEIQEALH